MYSVLVQMEVTHKRELTLVLNIYNYGIKPSSSLLIDMNLWSIIRLQWF